jgi:hypothetical protein
MPVGGMPCPQPNRFASMPIKVYQHTSLAKWHTLTSACVSPVYAHRDQPLPPSPRTFVAGLKHACYRVIDAARHVTGYFRRKTMASRVGMIISTRNGRYLMGSGL